MMPGGDGAGGPGGRLAGLRILVVEDETAVAMMVEDMLADFGCEVVGCASRVARALELARRAELDAAVLDVNVAGEDVFPVADALAARGVALVFATGYGDARLPEPHRHRPTVQKPFQRPQLRRALGEALAAGRGRAVTP